MTHRLTFAALALAIATPLLYFGIQLVVAPFYPQYSFLTMDASTLGSTYSPVSSLFNTGLIATGVATCLAAFGFYMSLRYLGIGRFLSWLVCLAIAQNGLATIWAGVFVLPDSRHNTGILGVVGLLVLPPLLIIALWNRLDAGAMKSYLVITCLLILLLIPVMSGATGIDTRPYAGLLQRFVALVLFFPLAVAACYFARRVRKSDSWMGLQKAHIDADRLIQR